MGENISYIMKVAPVSTILHLHVYYFLCISMEQPLQKQSNNQPHIVMFKSEEGSEQLNQYFVSVEQELMLETSIFDSSYGGTLCVSSVISL